jgi:predicted alpha/beta hydrolase family esterase
MNEIEKLGLCKGAIHFRNQYPDFQAAWDNCPRGDWMLWLAEKLNVDDRKLILAKGLCANTVIHLMKDERSKKAVRVAIDYGKGKLTKKELIAAADDADDAAADADDASSYANDASSYAAAAAADAAYAYADDAYAAAADAADASSYAAAAAANAADDAAAAAKKENQKQTADICREILTDEVFKLIKLKS